MAKFEKCEICGKEEKVGFLGGYGLVYPGQTINLCKECAIEKDKYSKALKKMIDAKLYNKKKFAEKATKQEILELLKEIDERREQSKERIREEFFNCYVSCFHTDGRGNFITNESEVSFVDSDIDVKSMLKREEKNGQWSGLVFTKDDITNTTIYYSRPNTTATVQDTNIKGQSYTIMLNNPNALSTKPCFVKASLVLPCDRMSFTANKEFDVVFEAGLSAFLREIGSDAKIERIKKFKKGAI